MKRSANTSWLLLALVLLCGCGGGYGGYKAPGGGTPSPVPQALKTISNWHFTMTSTVSQKPPIGIDGTLTQSGSSSISGAVHVDGSNCFDRLTTMDLTGSMTGGDLSLTSAAVAGQVAALTGNIAGDSFAGTYAISGGCADGDQGHVTGIRIFSIPNSFTGTFTTSGGGTYDVSGYVHEGSASPEGSIALIGLFSFNTSCFSSATTTPGTFPTGSFIMGTTVGYEVETGNGTLAFLGTLDPVTREIKGNYKVSGGICDQTGSADLVAGNPWDY